MKKGNSDKILLFLKMRSRASTQMVAHELGISKEGARKHLLLQLHAQMVQATTDSVGKGRPTTYYSLTAKGRASFPDSHADVTVQLLQSVRNILGEQALSLLIDDREKIVLKKYTAALKNTKTIEQKLHILTSLRTEEGYMASWSKEGSSYLLLEDHCPICAAASTCQGFCQSELNNFQQLLGENVLVAREEYLLNGGNRCSYRITPVQ